MFSLLYSPSGHRAAGARQNPASVLHPHRRRSKWTLRGEHYRGGTSTLSPPQEGKNKEGVVFIIWANQRQELKLLTNRRIVDRMAPLTALWRQGDVANHKRWRDNQCELAPFRQYNLDTITPSRFEKPISSRIYHAEAGNFTYYNNLAERLVTGENSNRSLLQNRQSVLCRAMMLISSVYLCWPYSPHAPLFSRPRGLVSAPSET